MKWLLICLFMIPISIFPTRYAIATNPCRIQRIQQVQIIPQVFYFVGQPLRIQALINTEQYRLQQTRDYQEYQAWKQKQYLNKFENATAPSLIINNVCHSCHGGKNPQKPAGRLTLLTGNPISDKIFKEAVLPPPVPATAPMKRTLE